MNIIKLKKFKVPISDKILLIISQTKSMRGVFDFISYVGLTNWQRHPQLDYSCKIK